MILNLCLICNMVKNTDYENEESESENNLRRMARPFNLNENINETIPLKTHFSESDCLENGSLFLFNENIYTYSIDVIQILIQKFKNMVFLEYEDDQQLTKQYTELESCQNSDSSYKTICSADVEVPVIEKFCVDTFCNSNQFKNYDIGFTNPIIHSPINENSNQCSIKDFSVVEESNLQLLDQKNTKTCTYYPAAIRNIINKKAKERKQYYPSAIMNIKNKENAEDQHYYPAAILNIKKQERTRSQRNYPTYI